MDGESRKQAVGAGQPRYSGCTPSEPRLTIPKLRARTRAAAMGPRPRHGRVGGKYTPAEMPRGRSKLARRGCTA